MRSRVQRCEAEHQRIDAPSRHASPSRWFIATHERSLRALTLANARLRSLALAGSKRVDGKTG